MGLNAADKYFIQALDNYRLNMEEAINALNYALSHDGDHAGAHYLMGRVNMEYLLNYENAAFHFQMSIASASVFPETYIQYAFLLIKTKEFNKALKIIKYAKTIKGINEAKLAQLSALVFERKGELKDAKKCFEEAFNLSFDTEEREYFKSETERIKSKIKEMKSKKEKEEGQKVNRGSKRS